MGRKLTLKPRFDKSRQEWVLSIPARLSPTGARRRLFWARGEEQEAIDYADKLKTGLDHFKDRAKDISPDLMRAAVKWNDVVMEYGFHGLEHFCATKLAELDAASKSPTLSSLLDAFEKDHQKNWSPQYLGKRWKPFRKRLHEVEPKKISVLDESFWRDWLAEWKKADKPGPTTYNQQMGMLRSIFELTAARKVHPINPFSDLPGAKDAKKAVPVSSPAEVRRLLAAAWEHDREMVPYFATCYFAGLRPDSEAKRVRFEHFDWKEGHLKVGVTKTDDNPTRHVHIEDALRQWMRAWMRKKGSIIPDNFAKRRRRLIYGFHTTPGATIGDEAKWKQLVPWGHDISRHTYGSMWEAAHRGEEGSVETLVANMGHVDFKTFRRYYLNSRPRSEGAEFWAIRPPTADGNIIAMA
ncbi:site-specific integrase [Luteolibacter arcticus]|uniref:Site-specific integrase n=1 Tax=Luteolibacter arcticus TaxID=1581411 RepID=A0ABT3GGD9_9BACT|nr:site-specific integrase [Luteolibacter arcticus]MCW1922682.1 site-specific integrase [Luteolibacter arcticus]